MPHGWSQEKSTSGAYTPNPRRDYANTFALRERKCLESLAWWGGVAQYANTFALWGPLLRRWGCRDLDAQGDLGGLA